MAATSEELGRQAYKDTIILSLIHPVAIQFLLAPFAYMTGLFTGKEVTGIVTDIRFFILLSSILVFGTIIQYRTWARFDKGLKEYTDNTEAGKLLARHFIRTFINFFLISCWQICVALLGFELLFDMEMKYISIYAPVGMIAFGALMGSVLLTEIFTKTEEYFHSLHPEFIDVKPLSLKILIMVAGLLSGTVMLFVTVNSWVGMAQSMGRVLPIPLTVSNIILAATALCCMFYVLIRLTKEINALFSGLVESIDKIKIKEKEEEFLKKQMEQSVSRFRKLFNSLQDAVENKNFSYRITPESEYDDLALSLNDVLQTLEMVEIERADQNWFKTGVTELSRIVTGKQNMYHMTSQALQFIAEYCQAVIGTIFILDDETKEYTLTAVHALKRGKAFATSFKSGEGIAGQAVHQQKSILITDVPDDYIHIESSFVMGLPRCLLIIPLINEEQVVGVLELGSLENFSRLQTDFLESIAKTLAVAIGAILLNQQFSSLAAAMDRRKRDRRKAAQKTG